MTKITLIRLFIKQTLIQRWMTQGLGLLNSAAGSTTAQHQQTLRFKPRETRRKVERGEPFKKGLDLKSVWGDHNPSQRYYISKN